MYDVRLLVQLISTYLRFFTGSVCVVSYLSNGEVSGTFVLLISVVLITAFTVIDYFGYRLLLNFSYCLRLVSNCSTSRNCLTLLFGNSGNIIMLLLNRWVVEFWFGVWFEVFQDNLDEFSRPLSNRNEVEWRNTRIMKILSIIIRRKLRFHKKKFFFFKMCWRNVKFDIFTIHWKHWSLTNLQKIVENTLSYNCTHYTIIYIHIEKTCSPVWFLHWNHKVVTLIS